MTILEFLQEAACLPRCISHIIKTETKGHCDCGRLAAVYVVEETLAAE